MRGMPIPEDLLHFARELRRNQTDAECFLWQILRGRRFCGYKFRRQHPLAGYILDFYCHEALLAVELDGGGHSKEETRGYDEKRRLALEREGIKIIRFWNHDVLNASEDVLQALYNELFEPMSPHPPCGHLLPREKGHASPKVR